MVNVRGSWKLVTLDLVFFERIRNLTENFFDTRQSHMLVTVRVLFKIFGVLSKDSISDICYYFGLLSADEAICVRQDRFRNPYSASENGICCVLSKH